MHRILLALVAGTAMAVAPAWAEPQAFGAAVHGSFAVASPGVTVGDVFTIVSPETDTIAEAGISAGSTLVLAAVNRGTTHARIEAVSGGLYTQALALATFTDTIRFVGLPDGTLVDIEIRHAPEYSVQSTNACGAGWEPTQAQMQAVFSIVGLFIGGPGVRSVYTIDNTCNAVDAASAPSAIITVVVGQAYEIENHLLLTAFAELGFSSSVDARNTFFITPLGDFDYVTASGNDYRRPDDEPTVEELLEVLVRMVTTLNNQAGISNSLDAKIDAARNALDDVNQNNDGAAINSLQALINHVEAQRGNKLTDEQADELIAAALAIIEAIQSGGG
jgi:hypothetical protein